MKKFALITGASGGIGSAIAEELASQGWNLYLHYNENKQNVLDLINQLSHYEVECMPIYADLSTKEGAHQLSRNVFQIDAIVYSSGSAPYGLFSDLTEEEMDKMWQLHVKSPMVLIQSLLSRLMQRSSSRIVLISSIWGQTGAACEVLYSTVKGAQIAFVKSLSKEIARSSVRINCVAPGAVKTNMIAQFDNQELEEMELAIPLGYIAEPKDISGTVSFLLSERSSYITGQVLAVNGGWYT
ncbi:3-oxoacyl-[acyl-carrier protein] reductase [Lederbergia galactosidilyticus]|uniref:elongation factor P 5-aminopentanone reductase n=1 Tax=Lederbergia galactosidilytica TaxID=217031 RepID=UPI001AE6F3E2|nr:SDR family oxidoreductase [Lederbergia galactosidilytica]MBP1913593.1 3-oxoacyl-[acyl-carrier protein] reductase [Lederbergia galactosidilytica]